MIKSKKYLKGDINKIKKNIENIADINSKDDEFGNTILHEAVYRKK